MIDQLPVKNLTQNQEQILAASFFKLSSVRQKIANVKIQGKEITQAIAEELLNQMETIHKIDPSQNLADYLPELHLKLFENIPVERTFVEFCKNKLDFHVFENYKITINEMQKNGGVNRTMFLEPEELYSEYHSKLRGVKLYDEYYYDTDGYVYWGQYNITKFLILNKIDVFYFALNNIQLADSDTNFNAKYKSSDLASIVKYIFIKWPDYGRQQPDKKQAIEAAQKLANAFYTFSNGLPLWLSQDYNHLYHVDLYQIPKELTPNLYIAKRMDRVIEDRTFPGNYLAVNFDYQAFKPIEFVNYKFDKKNQLIFLAITDKKSGKEFWKLYDTDMNQVLNGKYETIELLNFNNQDIVVDNYRFLVTKVGGVKEVRDIDDKVRLRLNEKTKGVKILELPDIYEVELSDGKSIIMNKNSKSKKMQTVTEPSKAKPNLITQSNADKLSALRKS